MALKTELRKVDSFNSIHIGGIAEVTLEQMSGPDPSYSVEIEADESVLEKITSQVIGDRLRVGFDAPWWDVGYWISWAFLPEKKMRLKITYKELQDLTFAGAGSVQAGPMQLKDCRFRLSGSAKLKLNDLQAGDISTDISGSAEVKLNGQAEQHILTISGTGRVDAEHLATKTTRVRIAGSGSAKVDASGQLQVYISGSGSVEYRGEPVLLQKVSGSGSIRQIRGG